MREDDEDDEKEGSVISLTVVLGTVYLPWSQSISCTLEDFRWTHSKTWDNVKGRICRDCCQYQHECRLIWPRTLVGVAR